MNTPLKFLEYHLDSLMKGAFHKGLIKNISSEFQFCRGFHENFTTRFWQLKIILEFLHSYLKHFLPLGLFFEDHKSFVLLAFCKLSAFPIGNLHTWLLICSEVRATATQNRAKHTWALMPRALLFPLPLGPNAL